MWWDDDPKATGFGVRSYPGGGQVLLRRLPDRRAPAPDHHRPVPALVRRRRARAGEGTAQADRPGPRPGRQQARAPGGADGPGPDRPLHRGPPAEEVAGADAHRRREADARRDRQASRQAHQGRRRPRRRHREMHRKIGELIGRGGKPRRVRANRILTVCSKMFSLSLVPRAGENAAVAQRRPRQPLQGRSSATTRKGASGSSAGGIGGDQRRPGGVSRRRGRLRAADHADRLPAVGGHEGDVVGIRRRAGLLDQAVRSHQAAQDAQAAAEPGGDRADRSAAQEAQGAKWVFPGDKSGRAPGRALARLALRTEAHRPRPGRAALRSAAHLRVASAPAAA